MSFLLDGGDVELLFKPDWTLKNSGRGSKKSLMPEVVSLICERITQSTENQNLSRGRNEIRITVCPR